jgi:hypothetical protein
MGCYDYNGFGPWWQASNQDVEIGSHFNLLFAIVNAPIYRTNITGKCADETAALVAEAQEELKSTCIPINY